MSGGGRTGWCVLGWFVSMSIIGSAAAVVAESVVHRLAAGELSTDVTCVFIGVDGVLVVVTLRRALTVVFCVVR